VEILEALAVHDIKCGTEVLFLLRCTNDMYADGFSITGNGHLPHRIPFSPSHPFRVLKQEAQGMQIMPDCNVANFIDLDSVTNVPFDLPRPNVTYRRGSKEGQKRRKTCFNAPGSIRFLPVANIFTPGNEFAGTTREILSAFNRPTAADQLLLPLLESFGGPSIRLCGL